MAYPDLDEELLQRLPSIPRIIRVAYLQGMCDILESIAYPMTPGWNGKVSARELMQMFSDISLEIQDELRALRQGLDTSPEVVTIAQRFFRRAEGREAPQSK